MNYSQIGITLAKDLDKAESTATNTKRKAILQIAEKFASTADAFKGILEGVEKHYTDLGHSDGSIRKVKSEIKSVFDAVEKTVVSGENLKKLQGFDGSYHDFIDLARTLRGKKEGNRGSREVAGKITEKQQAAIHEKLADGSPSQLTAIATDAVKNMLQGDASLAGKQTLLVIEAHARALLNNGKVEQFFHLAAQAILDVTGPALEQLDKAEEQAKNVGVLKLAQAA